MYLFVASTLVFDIIAYDFFIPFSTSSVNTFLLYFIGQTRWYNIRFLLWRFMTCSDIHLSYHPPRSRAARKSFLLYDIQKRSKWKHFYRAETFSLYRKGSFGEPFRYTLCFSLFFRRLLRCWFWRRVCIVHDFFVM